MLFGNNSRQKMQHPVKNSSYRDIYNERGRYRGKRRKGEPKAPFIIGCFAVVLFTYLITLSMFAGVWNALDNMIGVPSNGMPHDMLILALGMNYWSFLLYAINLGFSTVICIMIMRQWHVVNISKDPKDLNTYRGDAHIRQPETLPKTFDIAPDAGDWFGRNVTAVLSHLPITNGDKLVPGHHLKDVMQDKRYRHDTKVTDQYGHTVLKHKGDLILDNDGLPIQEEKPMIDEQFSEALLDTSFVPRIKSMRIHYNPFKLLYNPNNQLGKPNYRTVGQMINADWTHPANEIERPGGMYVVDTQPDNTMVLAMTRAGKGQTIIEPTIDMWTRQRNKWNVVVNDPKGELYVEFYYPATKRGYQVIAFNLINERRTSIYNPLGYAVEANRQGDSQKADRLISGIGKIFFPNVKGQDPMWNNAANAAFRRSALGLIDFYQDEDNAIRDRARHLNNRAKKMHKPAPWTPGRLSRKLDNLWAHVSLYNVYQMMTTLASKKSDDIGSDKDMTDLGFICLDKDEKKQLLNDKKIGKDISKDYLTLYFDALQKLPENAIRREAINQDNNLRSMAKSEKTLSSVYGIALTGMNFFTDPTIAKLTSGRPSQNFDMEGLGFPRRIQVRMAHDYMHREALGGQHFRWDAFKDKHFSIKDNTPYRKDDSKDPNPYTGSDFAHQGDINGHGWISYIFKGKFDNAPAYLRLRMYDLNSGILMKTYYFQFLKGYQKSANGMTYVEDPVNHVRIVHGGTLREMQKVGEHPAKDSNGQYIYVGHGKGRHKKMIGDFKFGDTTYQKRRVSLVQDNDRMPSDTDPGHYKSFNQTMKAFTQTNIHYTEKPKMVFFITPPHMAQYARIILILLDQMFNVQVSRSYMTKANQKPLYGTNYMLDEVGNLRSQGKGIPFLQTKESIGLGQDQRYTLILQTVQQLKDIYGKSIDKVLQGNTKNIIYLKSTDDSMIKLLSSMSGTTHITVNDSLGYNQNLKRIAGKTGARTSRNWTVKKVPLINTNDFQLIPRDSSIVIGHGNPVWSQRQCALPMSWRLLKDQNSLHKYSLGTVPSTVNNDQFHMSEYMPDFYKMVRKRVAQARLTPVIVKRYKVAHHLTDTDLSKMDDEVLSRELMQGINAQLNYDNHKKAIKEHKIHVQEAEDRKQANASIGGTDPESQDAMHEAEDRMNKQYNPDNDTDFGPIDHGQHNNPEFSGMYQRENQIMAKYDKKRFAGGQLSISDLVPISNAGNGDYQPNYTEPIHENDPEIATAYYRCINSFKNDSAHFSIDSKGSLHDAKTGQIYIINTKNDKATKNKYMNLLKHNKGRFKKYEDQTKDSHSIMSDYMVLNSFIVFLAKQDNWNNFANGDFEKEMTNVIPQYDREK